MTENVHIDVDDKHQQIVTAILREILPQAKVWAFGSRVQGNAQKYSDLDLAIDNGAALDIRQLAELNALFSESLLPWRVDIVDLHACSQDFRQIIQSCCVMVQ